MSSSTLEYPGWDRIAGLFAHEFVQCAEEGKDPKAIALLKKEYEAAGGNRDVLESVHEKLLVLPVLPEFPFEEPSDLEGIRRLRKGPSRKWPAASGRADLHDKMHGAWLGRCSGCALGKPVEMMMGAQDGMLSWQRQRRYLTAISPEEWPLRDYIPGHSPAAGENGVGEVGCSPSWRENIAFMESDDDIRYTVLGQLILLEKGEDFTTGDVARMWMGRLPYKSVCTAETQAYRNMVEVGGFHMGATFDPDWSWVATRLNPYREWIGAQIRVDSYGYAAPGNPELAAEFACRDARLSHVKNGIYGAMFCAAMIAAAFATDDVREIVEAGLAEIPATSRLHAELRQVIAFCDRHGCRRESFEEVVGEVYRILGHYHPIHTNNNAALCVVALLLSGGDFHHGITMAVMGGLDTDCNGATVGSIVGAINGARKAPTHWTGRLNDTLKSEIIDYHPIAISECARRSLDIALRVAGKSET